MKREKRKFDNLLSTTANMLVEQPAVTNAASVNLRIIDGDENGSSSEASSRSSSPITAPDSPNFSDDDILGGAFDKLNLAEDSCREPALKRLRTI